MNYRPSIAILILGILISCSMDSNKPQKYSTILTRKRANSNPHTFEDLSMADCKDFAVLMSSSKLSRKLKKPKDWIVANYQIPIHPDTLASTTRVIGHVPPGGNCYIVEQVGRWFFVQSPGNNELGWLNQDFVVGFIKMNPTTRLPCPG